jgi:hypothetical protein
VGKVSLSSGKKMRERIAGPRVLYLHCTGDEIAMDPQDQELLDKQLRNLHVPPRRDDVVVATIIAVFLGGIIIGGALAVPRQPTPNTANPQIASVLIGAPATARQ